MDVDGIIKWMEETLPDLIVSLFLFGVLIVTLTVLLRLSRQLITERKRGSLTKEQRNAERAAIEKLTRAQQLLMESDENVEEAQRLRDEVTRHDLPKHKMYIRAEAPNSLLTDVDNRIFHARLRLQRETDSDTPDVSEIED
jgi:Co/Zn/Cd efflux system component